MVSCIGIKGPKNYQWANYWDNKTITMSGFKGFLKLEG